MKKTFIFLLAALVISVAATGQTNKALLDRKRADALQKAESLSETQIIENFKKYHQRKPVQHDLSKIKIQKAETSTAESKAELAVPDNMIFPNEADEVQAILMTWLYDSYTVNGDNYAEPMFEGLGFDYYDATYTLVDIYSVPDVASNSPYAKLFASLANGIQQYTQVWINIWDGADSTLIKDYMTSRGTPLTNYRFFISPGNSFWYRDCGPVAFYYGEEDSIAFMDFEYYGGRPMDDKLPVFIGQQAGFPVYTNTIEYEGGNILLDGAGSLFTSSAVYDLNQDNYGLYVQDPNNPYNYSLQYKPALSKANVNDSLTHLLNLSRCVVLPALNYDGGTGHVDLYMDMWDENTFVSTKHPDVMANLSDPKRVESNMDSITKLTSMHGVNYHNTRIPLPTKDDGTWYSSQTQYNNSYTRSYSNHTFVNKGIMQPVFHTGTSGYEQGDSAAIEIMKVCYPGYEFTEIDVRTFDGYGGAIHCITKQIPAENPVRIYHDPVRTWNTASGNPAVVRAICQNKSGIESVTLYYRKKGEQTWNSQNMWYDSYSMWYGALPLEQNTAQTIDTMEYYLSATSNNGKTITKPITASQGFYSTAYAYNVDGVGLQSAASITDMHIGEFSPNPSNGKTELRIEGGLKSDLAVRIVSVKGQVLYSDVLKQGTDSFELNTENFRSGVYWAIFGQNGNTTARKLVVVK
ncbi:MAG: agmatine deiminase family protein [Bacteroidales bacterium]|jgi:agmatine/peptidylarginine deiminase|nr:agmatine deiminase family protein [Bacteroidales bacterium]